VRVTHPDADVPWPLLGRGRAADVYDVGGGRVLRRYRNGASCEHEFAIMRELRSAGYPVPEVFEVEGPDLVMERLRGRTMLDELGSAPWRIRPLARQLADLHRRLAEVRLDGVRLDGVDRLRRFVAAGDEPVAIAHLDLHPDNVMLTSAGPVVFDWANASLAPAGTDVAMTWILMSTSEVDAPPWIRPIAGFVRSRFLAAFLDAAAGLPDRELVHRIVEHRLTDPNVLPTEITRLHELRRTADAAGR
jgi:aminoglycoside phosphotransferase (APT) family kinase protein